MGSATIKARPGEDHYPIGRFILHRARVLGLTRSDLVRRFGYRDIGSGLIIYEYALEDGSKVLLGFPGRDKILYAKHVTKDGKADELPLK